MYGYHFHAKTPQKRSSPVVPYLPTALFRDEVQHVFIRVGKDVKKHPRRPNDDALSWLLGIILQQSRRNGQQRREFRKLFACGTFFSSKFLAPERDSLPRVTA